MLAPLEGAGGSQGPGQGWAKRGPGLHVLTEELELTQGQGRPKGLDRGEGEPGRSPGNPAEEQVWPRARCTLVTPSQNKDPGGCRVLTPTLRVTSQAEGTLKMGVALRRRNRPGLTRRACVLMRRQGPRQSLRCDEDRSRGCRPRNAGTSGSWKGGEEVPRPAGPFWTPDPFGAPG